MTQARTVFIVLVLAIAVGCDTCASASQLEMSDINALLDKFCGKYYFNDSRNYNFVAVTKFQTEQEKLDMIRLFKPSVPKAREDMPALKIMMRRPGTGIQLAYRLARILQAAWQNGSQQHARSEDDLFVHDTLYNIAIHDRGSELVMECWTGDMQLTVDGKISRNQAEGKTIITLNKSAGKASMDIGGGFGEEKWVMTF